MTWESARTGEESHSNLYQVKSSILLDRITLLSVPSQILLHTIKGALGEKLREEQAGFREHKACSDNIATLRVIIEQSIEWQSPLYINFINFEKAVDSVDRDVIWMLMRHYGIPAKFVALIQQMYETSTCQVINNGKLSETFEVKTGHSLNIWMV